MKSLGRRFRVGLAATAVACVVFVVAGLPVYVFPSDDSVEDVDAILVLGPPGADRLAVARDMARAHGGVPVLVSGDLATFRSKQTPGWELPVSEHWAMPAPFTTKGEALLASEWAEREGWKTIAVITTTPHVSRARFIFDRCFVGDAQVVSSGFTGGNLLDWGRHYVYQTGAFLKAVITSCA